jgi:hypothetical protein
VVAGVSGVGKTSLARRIADIIGAPHTEIDALYHGAGWVPREEFLDDVHALIAEESWTTEWQYATARPLLAARADVMVWLAHAAEAAPKRDPVERQRGASLAHDLHRPGAHCAVGILYAGQVSSSGAGARVRPPSSDGGSPAVSAPGRTLADRITRHSRPVRDPFACHAVGTAGRMRFPRSQRLFGVPPSAALEGGNHDRHEYPERHDRPDRK